MGVQVGKGVVGCGTVEVAVGSVVGVSVAAADVGAYTVDVTTAVSSFKDFSVVVMPTAGWVVGAVESCMSGLSHAARSRAKSANQQGKEKFINTGGV